MLRTRYAPAQSAACFDSFFSRPYIYFVAVYPIHAETTETFSYYLPSSYLFCKDNPHSSSGL